MKKLIILLSLLIFGVFTATAQEEIPCKVIREIHYPVTKTEPSKQPLRIALLNLCPKDLGMEARPMLSFFINGKVVMKEYVVEKVFENQQEADKYARENNIKEPKFENPVTEDTADCQIIRTINFPLTKKANVKKEKKIALLNTCLSEEPPLQRPTITVFRNGKKVVRTFASIRTFATRKEAKEYAKANNIKDIKF